MRQDGLRGSIQCWSDHGQVCVTSYTLRMTEVVAISEAKANLSKLVKRAEAGETIYIGAYGKVQAVLAPAPVRKPIPLGVWEDKKADFAIDEADLIRPDPDIAAEFEASISRTQADDDR